MNLVVPGLGPKSPALSPVGSVGNDCSKMRLRRERLLQLVDDIRHARPDRPFLGTAKRSERES